MNRSFSALKTTRTFKSFLVACHIMTNLVTTGFTGDSSCISPFLDVFLLHEIIPNLSNSQKNSSCRLTNFKSRSESDFKQKKSKDVPCFRGPFSPYKCTTKKNLRIQVCPKEGISLQSYSGDGIKTIDPALGKGLDS